MDCDDVSMPERLQKQVDFLERNSEIGVVGSDIIIFGEDQEDSYFEFVHDKDGCKAGLLFNTCFAHPTVMYRRSIIVENGLYYDNSYQGLEDFELWWRISRYAELANIHEPLLRYRKHKSQVTENVTGKIHDKEIEFHKELFMHYAKFEKRELDVSVSYCLCGGSNFELDDVKIFFSVLEKILGSPYSNKTKSFHKAMQVTLSKALVYALSNLPQLKVSRPIIFTKALMKGIMPVDWYCKFMFYELWVK